MLGTTDINTLFEGIDKYAKFYGYNKSRTLTGPEIGENTLAQLHIYQGYQCELLIKVDKTEEGSWVIKATVVNEIGESEWEQTIESDLEELDKLAKVVEKDILKNIPRNKTEGTRADESVFLNNFIKSTLYIIEGEFNSLFKK